MKTRQYKQDKTEIKPFERPRLSNESCLSYYVTEAIAYVAKNLDTDI